MPQMWQLGLVYDMRQIEVFDGKKMIVVYIDDKINFNKVFPDCSICKKPADDGGWLDNKNYRFWVCIDCDDWIDEVERKKGK